MKKIKLPDGTPTYCLKSAEAVVLDDHIKGYFNHGISIEEEDVVFDIGANIGVFGLRASQEYNNIEIHCFEPVPQIFEVLNCNVKLSLNPQFYAYQMGLVLKMIRLVSHISQIVPRYQHLILNYGKKTLKLFKKQ